MIAIVDTNYFIAKKVTPEKFTKIIIPQSVFAEIKDEETRIYYSFKNYNLEISNPEEKTRQIVQKINHERNLALSHADIDVVALMLEHSDKKFNTWLSKDKYEDYICLSDDNGIKQALNILELADGIKEKKWKYKCHTCEASYDEKRDFCRKCGYNTITRMSYYENGNELVFNYKNGYVPKFRDIKDKKGNKIISEDQKEYKQYIVEPLICILQYCVYCSLVLEQSTLLYKLIVYSMKYSILQ